MSPNRTAVTALLLASFVNNGILAGDDLSFEPYPVYVVEADSYTRCGPSDDYYRTDPLRHGQALEVYAETDDGWLGIRPPDDSFCWVQAETIELSDGGETGTVIEDRTVAWIGTHLGRARSYRWQVQMAAGEAVTVIGKSEREGPDGPQLWYRIVPPSGEYRWVHRDQVVSTSEELVAATQQIQQRRARADRETSDSAEAFNQRGTTPEEQHAIAEAGGDSVIEPSRKPPASERDQWRNSQRRLSVHDAAATQVGLDPAPTEANVPAGVASMQFIGRPRLAVRPATGSLPNGIEQVSGQQPLPVRSRGPSSSPATKPLRIMSPERIGQIEAEVREADVTQLDLIFSRLIAARATAAEVEPVYRAAKQLSTTASDPIFAGRARMLAERANQYRRLASRRDGLSVIGTAGALEIPTPTIGAATVAVAASEVNTSDLAQPPEGGPNHENETTMTGQLVQVYSVRNNSPPFALTDNAGRTIAYVTPTPGINLRVHLNSRVRVVGRQGYLTGLNTPHILASQAVREVP